MKHLTEHLWFETPHRRDYFNITDTVAQLVLKSGVQEGLCRVNAMHITASVYINDADAHMKRQLMGREVVVATTKGKLDLGPWEQIFYGEFDGRRRKRVLVKIIGE